MPVTSNIGIHIYTDQEFAQAFQTVRQWREQLSGNSATSDFYLIDQAIGELQQRKTINVVNSLPTANQTEYAKHLIYSYQNSLYFIIYDNNEYSLVQVGKTYSAGNGIAISAAGVVSVSALRFTNVTASTWVSDSTYQDYGYKCDITCQGVTSDMYIEVVFGVTEATSGDYAPVCLSSSNTVTIYSKVNDSITIPLIKEVV